MKRLLWSSPQLGASLLVPVLLLGACTADEHHAATAQKPTATANGSAAMALPATALPTPAPVTVPQTVSRVAPSDAAFTQAQFESSAVEIELARIAYVRAQSPDVRAFARQMLIDHRAMAVKLDNFALERGVLVDWQIEPDRAATIERLRSLDDASFDRAYMDEMVKAHEKAVAALEAQVGSGRETAAVATAAMPTVQHHLEMARQIHARL